MAKTGNGQESIDRRRQRKRTLPEAQFEKLIAFIERHRAGRTNVELGKIANITPSTLTMILKRDRVPSVKVIRQLAKALRPANSRKSLEDFTEEFLKLAMYEPSVVADIGLPESITTELDHLRVAYIVNEPFVEKDWRRGFAADLFEYVVALIKGKVDIRLRREPNQLQELMEKREADVVVSAIFPTFQRDMYMDFSKPFPYLRVPLSALVRKGTHITEGAPLTLGHVLNWTKRSEGIRDTRMLLVNGEVGHDFVTTFLKEVNPPDYDLIDTLDPNQIYEQLLQKPKVNLFLANLVTCSSVYELARNEFIPLPDDDALTMDKAVPTTEQYAGFPVLAMYPVTFGLPEGDNDWKVMIDGALDSLMTEGASLLVSLYRTYLERDKRFAGLCNPEDDLVTSEPLKEMFRSLFETHGLLKAAESVDTVPREKVQKAKK